MEKASRPNIAVSAVGLALVLLAALPATIWLARRWSRPAPPRLGADAGSQQTEALLRAALDKSPRDPAIHLQLGSYLIAHGKSDEAVSVLAGSCASPVTAGAAAALLGQAATTPALATMAVPSAQLAVAVAPRDSRAWQALTRVLFAAGRPGPARAALEEGLRRFPQAAPLHFIRAELAAVEGDSRQAIEDYDAGLRIQPDAHAQLMVGLILAQTHGTKRARDAFSRAVDLDPSSLLAYLGLAKADLELGLNDEAERTAYTALQFAPADPEALLMLVRVLVAKGDATSVATAQELAQRVIRLAPENLDAHYYLGVVQLRAGNARDAVKQFQVVVAAQPQRSEARQQYVRALQQSGQSKEATDQAKIAAQLGELEEQRNHLTARVSQLPKDPGARCDLADFYLAHNALPLAVRTYQKALQLRPNFPRAVNGLKQAQGTAQ